MYKQGIDARGDELHVGFGRWRDDLDGCSWRVLELEVEVVHGASARPVREEEQDAQQDCGGEERCHRPHDDCTCIPNDEKSPGRAGKCSGTTQ